MYSELLRSRLAGAATEGDDAPPVAELVAEMLTRRREIDAVGSEPESGLAAALDYDTALVRLCLLLGVEQRLTDDFPPADARRQAEVTLTSCLPALADAFASPG